MPPLAARETPEWFAVCAFPDVCTTYVGPTPVRVPYVIITRLGQSEGTSRRTNFGGNSVFTRGSTVPVCTGNAAAVGGVRSLVTGGACYSLEDRPRVRIEGHGSIFDGSRIGMNAPSHGAPWNTWGFLVQMAVHKTVKVDRDGTVVSIETESYPLFFSPRPGAPLVSTSVIDAKPPPTWLEEQEAAFWGWIDEKRKKVSFGGSVSFDTIFPGHAEGGTYGLNLQYTYHDGLVLYLMMPSAERSSGVSVGLSYQVNLAWGTGSWDGVFPTWELGAGPDAFTYFRSEGANPDWHGLSYQLRGVSLPVTFAYTAPDYLPLVRFRPGE